MNLTLVDQIYELNKTLLQNLKNQVVMKESSMEDKSPLKLQSGFSKFTSLFATSSKPVPKKDEIIVKESVIKQSVAECFKKLSPFLKMYTTYINSYAQANQMLLNLQESNQTFAKFIASTRRDVNKFKGMDLMSLLITPIQRIPRYPLLLEELVKCTPDPDEKEELMMSLQLLKEIANDLNSKRGVWESQSLTNELLQKFRHFSVEDDSNDSSQIRHQLAYRRFVRNGVLKFKMTRYGPWHPVQVYLFTDVLLICDDEAKLEEYRKEAEEQGLLGEFDSEKIGKKYIHLALCLDCRWDERFSTQFFLPVLKFIFSFETLSEVRDPAKSWADDLQRLIVSDTKAVVEYYKNVHQITNLKLNETLAKKEKIQKEINLQLGEMSKMMKQYADRYQDLVRQDDQCDDILLKYIRDDYKFMNYYFDKTPNFTSVYEKQFAHLEKRDYSKMKRKLVESPVRSSVKIGESVKTKIVEWETKKKEQSTGNSDGNERKSLK